MFRNLNNLRELYIDERCFQVEEHGLSGIDRLDFLTLRGVCVLGSETFANSSRIHNLLITDSTLNLKANVFAKLSHVNQVSTCFCMSKSQSVGDRFACRCQSSRKMCTIELHFLTSADRTPQKQLITCI